MSEHLQSLLKKVTGASAVSKIEVIQRLWSDYGQIVRYGLTGSELSTVVVKQVLLHEPQSHPKGWKSSHSHERKVKSYQVETAWYKTYNLLCNEGCRTPRCFALEMQGDEVFMVLQDLDSAGYFIRKRSLSWMEIKACLSWLANFHATFMEKSTDGLWETGTYWHLETRKEELEVLEDIPLKNHAFLIDQKLKASPFQTLVHGDAKLANFCFSEDDRVAAVDFQYVGGGCGMKDVAYFIGSCLNEEESEDMEGQVLDFYFSELKTAVDKNKTGIDSSRLEEDWRSLYHVAWADFHRFLKGWSPGHWKINSYSERISREVVLAFKQEKEF